jgi:DNA-binding LacI/PurR family transcriptional regulator
MGRGMAGISEVARQAGVSRTTVSHVFSGKRPVADATRDRVLDAAQALHYNPDSVARGLATGRSMTIGLVLPTSDDPAVLNPTWLMVLEGLSSAASTAGYGFLIASAEGTRPGNPDSEERVRSAFDGIIVLDPVGRTALLPGLRGGTPVVTVGRHLGRVAIPWADTDNVAGMHQLLAHLRAEGFERPALLSIDAEISYIEDIENAFRAAAGPDPVIVRAAGLSEIEAYGRATQLLSGGAAQGGAPDAIVAASDRQATGVLRAARELGLRVPLDVGIAGQGDTVISRNSRPALTSIRIHPRDLGAAAVDMLLELISGRPVANVTIPVEVAVRDSTRRRTRA